MINKKEKYYNKTINIMDNFILNLLFVQLVPLLYILLTTIDYLKHKEAYHNYPEIKDKSKKVSKNIFFYLPITHLIVFSLFPHQVIFKSGFKELMFFVMEILFTDIYFYTTHRICHENKYLYKKIHKTHHEIKDTLGIFAFYCHPTEMIVVNMGNFYITHIIFRHSYFHSGTLAIIGFGNTILGAHETNNERGHHQLHHLYRKCNYGLNLFMDRLMGTEQMPE